MSDHNELLGQAEALLQDLSALGIRIALGSGDTLQYTSPKGAVTGEILTTIRCNKTAILNYLRSHRVKTAVPFTRTIAKASYDLSPAQTRLWVLSHLGQASVAYHVPGVYEVCGNLDIHALQTAFTLLLERHESLRTRFSLIGDVPQQIIEDIGAIRHDITRFFSNENSYPGKEQLSSLIRDEITKPFVLGEAPLARVSVIHTGRQSCILICVLHHIICDGVSVAVFARDLLDLYRSVTERRSAALLPLSFQYRDFADWQNTLISKNELDHEVGFWRNKLSGKVPRLDLVTDCRRPAKRRYAGASISTPISTLTAQTLKRFALSQKTTAFPVLLAAVKSLLHLYTGQTDIVVGIPVSGRNVPELEDQIGMYVNTLVIRDSLYATQTFQEIVRNVNETLSEAYSHQSFPFDKLVHLLNPPRDTARNPFFDIMVVMNEGVAFPAVPDLKIQPLETTSNSSKFDLIFCFNRHSDNLLFTIEYDSDLFSSEYIEHMSRHLLALLEAGMRRADNRIGDVNFLSDSEYEKVMYQFNSYLRTFPQVQSITHQFEFSVGAAEHKRALLLESNPADGGFCPNPMFTRGEVNIWANKVARRLREEYRVGPDVAVAVLLERSAQLLVAVLAVLKAGGAYVPIDPHAPRERVAAILKDCEARIVLTERHLCDGLPEEVTPVYVDAWGATGGNGGNLENVNRESDLAYIIYTSGSMGKPKGVMIEHRSALNTLFALESRYPMSEHAAYLMKTSFTFDVSATELFSWFFGDGGVVILAKGHEFDPLKLAAAIQLYQVTHVNFVPSMLRSFLEADQRGQWNLEKLRHILVAGEVFDQSLLTLAKSLGLSNRVSNIYGPTEASIYATGFDISATEAHTVGSSVSIGRPFYNTKAYVLAPNGFAPLPIGVPGELCLSGAGLARGYTDQGATAKSFVINPVTHKRVYRTGDLARWDASGNLEFIGRVDQQVKVRGFRVELAEIETVLRTDPQVHEVVVVFHPDAAGGKLLAYIVAEENVTEVSLRDTLRRRLPEYMIPSEYLRVDAIPRNQNGKVDRLALPRIGCRLASGLSLEPPEDGAEKKVLYLWRELLGQTEIGRNDNFFDRGGTSILLISLTARLCDTFGVQFGVIELFEHSTIATQARFVDQLKAQLAPTCPQTLESSPAVSLRRFQVRRRTRRSKLRGQIKPTSP